MHQKFENFIISSSAQVVAIALTSIAIMALFYARLDLLITMIMLTAYAIFCSWTATNSIKEYLTSKHFKELQHRKLYSRINRDSISVLVMMDVSFCLILIVSQRFVSLLTILIIILISLYIGKLQADTEIKLKPSLLEMNESQYLKRLDIIRSSIADLNEIRSTSLLNKDFSDLVGSIDYCVNYLPIEYFFQQYEFLDGLNLRTIDKIVKIANNSALDRIEEDIREMMIADVRSAKLSSDELLYYFNDTERN